MSKKAYDRPGEHSKDQQLDQADADPKTPWPEADVIRRLHHSDGVLSATGIPMSMDRVENIFQRKHSRCRTAALAAVLSVSPGTDQAGSSRVEVDGEALGFEIQRKLTVGTPLRENWSTPECNSFQDGTELQPTRIKDPRVVTRLEGEDIERLRSGFGRLC
jgi:hypothetical protein